MVSQPPLVPTSRRERAGLLLALPPLLLLPLTWFAGAHWLIELIVPWRPHMGVLAVLASLLMWPRHHVLGLGLFMLGVSHLVMLSPRLIPRAVVPAERRIDLISFNAQAENRTSGELLTWLGERDPDLVVILELSPELARRLAPLDERLPHQLLHPTDDRFGLGLWSRFPLAEAELIQDAGYVHSILALVDTPGEPLRLAATHVPPPLGAEPTRVRGEVLAKLALAVGRGGGPGLLVGDLNLTPWSPHLRLLRRTARLEDGGSGFGPHATWPAPVAFLGIPIDHVLVTPEVAVTRFATGPSFGSDHRSLIVRLTW